MLFWRITNGAGAGLGMNIYAVGDIHGCHDQLTRLLAAIERHAAGKIGAASSWAITSIAVPMPALWCAMCAPWWRADAGQR